MPTTSPVAPGTISRKMLSFDPNSISGRSSSGISTGATNTSEDYLWLCGEAITAGDAVTSPDVDGKVWKAKLLFADDKQAYFIAKANYAIDTAGVFQRTGKIRSESYNFETMQTVWLVTGSPNVSTTLPTITAGQNYQELGRSVSETEFIIDIEEPETVV